MFGLSLIRGMVERLFRAEARAAARHGIFQGIADALEEITGQRPQLPMDLTGQVSAQLNGDCDCENVLPDAVTVTLPTDKEVIGNGYSNCQRPELVSMAAARGIRNWKRKTAIQLRQSLKRLDEAEKLEAE